MFGLTSKKWEWNVSGKHPVAGDYFMVGASSIVAKGISAWVEKGYKSLKNYEMTKDMNSWRFWGKGVSKNHIICGLLTKSSDTIGREYPLLIIGTGYLKGIKKNWEYLPYIANDTWKHMERIATHKYSNLGLLEIDVCRIKPPEPNYNFSLQFLSNEAMQLAPQQIQDGNLIPLSQSNSDDLLNEVMVLHTIFKSRLRKLPNIVFIGGNSEKSFVTYFCRPLKTDDFCRLWTS